MNALEAGAMWRVLRGAFPTTRLLADTEAIYTQFFMKLPDPRRCMDALTSVVEGLDSVYTDFPKIGTIKAVYFGPTLREKYALPELEEQLASADADSEEWRQENLRRLRLMAIPGGVSMLALELWHSGELELSPEEVERHRLVAGDPSSAEPMTRSMPS